MFNYRLSASITAKNNYNFINILFYIFCFFLFGFLLVLFSIVYSLPLFSKSLIFLLFIHFGFHFNGAFPGLNLLSIT